LIGQTKKIIELSLGEARIVNGIFKLIHVINLEELENFCTNIKNATNQYLYNQPLLKQIIEKRINKIRQDIQTIIPKNRAKKSILPWLGSAWKFVAGNPDENDFAVLTEHMNGVLENSNQQTVINKNIEQRINQLTEKYNSWVKDGFSRVDAEFYLLDEVIHLRTEVDEIIRTIHLAKMGIINQQILDHEDIEDAARKIEENQLPVISVAQALDFGKISIAYHGNTIIMILNLPTVEKKFFEYNLIRPIIINKKIVRTDIKEFISNGDEFWAVTSKCSQVNGIYMCERKNLRSMAKDECIPNILRQRNATCDFTNSHHVNNVEEIANGIILINNYNANIASTCSAPRKIEGTFIIKFRNCTITIDKMKFEYSERPPVKIKEATFQMDPNIRNVTKLLSLQYLDELHLNHTKHLELIRIHHTWYAAGNGVLSFSLLVTIVIIICVIKKKQCRSNQARREEIPMYTYR
jgi:Gypsy protein